jgi:hypothetical protein
MATLTDIVWSLQAVNVKGSECMHLIRLRL